MPKTTELPVLTKKQAAWKNAWLINGGNATKAAITAEYSLTTAAVVGARNIRNDKILAHIVAEVGPLFKAEGITRERVLTELGILAFSNLQDVCTWGPNGMKLIESSELDSKHQRMISKVESHTRTTTRGIKNPQTETHTVVKIDVHSKIKALETLARILKLINTEREHSDRPPGAVQINLAQITIVQQMKPEDLAPRVV